MALNPLSVIHSPGERLELLQNDPVLTRVYLGKRTKKEKETCGRPYCIQPARKSDEYYVERLVGRKYSGMGALYLWLVKWDG